MSSSSPARIALAMASLAIGCAISAAPAESPPPSAAPAAAAETDPGGIPGRAPTAEERESFDRLLRLAERVRHLRFERPVPFRIQDREVITAFVRSKVDGDEIESARILYVALGLLDPDVDIRDLLIRVLGEQIVGYYDPEQSIMVVREDVVDALRGVGPVRPGLGPGGSGGIEEAEMVIVHELVHALQDQRLDLGARHAEDRDVDADNAFASLVEGDATLAMIGHTLEGSGQPLSNLTSNAPLLRQLVSGNGEAMAGGEELDQAPPVVRIPLISRYIDGMIFCATLHGEGGWPAVDRAHRRPPRSTEQILHPERYLAGDEPDTIALPEWPELAAAGFEVHDEETLGELEMAIYFGLGADAEVDRVAAEGWGGDRLRVYRRAADGRTAVVWWTTWDDVAEAREAEAAAARVVSRTPGSSPDAYLVRRRGRSLLMTRDLPASLAPPVTSAFDDFAATR